MLMLSARAHRQTRRRLLESTLVVVVGEFGRSPRIASNPYPGGEHWPQCYSALLAGGGVRGSLVHRLSDRMGAYPMSAKVVPEDLAATICGNWALTRVLASGQMVSAFAPATGNLLRPFWGERLRLALRIAVRLFNRGALRIK